MFITEQQKQIPVVDKYDTVVCGGGIAGISAALAAARHGAKTLLIEREFMLGGLATAGLIAIYLPISDGYGNQFSYGIAEELLKLCEKHGYLYYRNLDVTPTEETHGAPLPPMNNRLKVSYDPNVYAVDCEQLLLSEGVTLLYGTSAVSAITENQKITHLITENRDGRTAYAAKTFVDATGDAVLINAAGEKTAEYKKGNILASWYYNFGENKLELLQLGFSDDKLNAERCGNTTKYTEYDAESVTDFVVEGHKNLLNRFLKDGNVSDNHAVATIATVPQLRMTRRIDGRYVQDIDEIEKEYSDSIGMFVNWHKRYGTAYELPFSCLVGNNITNVIAAGRCISSTDELWDLTRVIPVCAVSGQAAGTAAAMFTDFRDCDIKELQNALINDGVKLHIKDVK